MSFRHFHGLAKSWFESQFTVPTSAQEQAWQSIKAGRHTLISAPTGTGKTLAAFYAAIDDLLQSGLDGTLGTGVQVVYVSPLKALSNDIRKNLEQPLDGIAEQLHLTGMAPVDIRVAVRSGDTPQHERQKMVRKPPHILVTTPESLYLLLTSAGGRSMLASVSTLIVDEIHALLGDKRGSHLALSMERLQHLVNSNGGELQRIGLSATQKPIDMVARFLVGGDSSAACDIIDSGSHRKIEVGLEVPGSSLTALMSNDVWEELYQRLVELIRSHDTTLVFVNTRRLSERLALALTNLLGEDCVCSHHGSMSKDHRHNAEQRLKAGDLKVLVATASMELGIDIGSVDLVVQFSSPKSIATFLQRVGRSGHSIHGTPKGLLFPLTRDDLAECTALLHSIKLGELDKIVMPEKPMDILAQQIVAEVACVGGAEEDTTGWDVELLYKLFSQAYPYRNLQKKEYLSLVSMLADGYTSKRGRRGALIHYDAINGKLRPRRGASLTALTNGGAIPDMFDYQVVLDPEDTVVGSLNEDFALEALPGDVFTLGTHAWQMLRIDGLKVRVRDAQGMQPTIPFWFDEGPGRTRELSEAVSRLRNTISDKIVDESLDAAISWLNIEVGLPQVAASQLVEYWNTGMVALGVMPTRETLVMERFFDEVGDMHVVIHSPFGSRINRGWGLALRKKFCRSFNFELQAAANEDSIVISLGSVHSFKLDDVFRYLQTSTLKDTLVQALLDAPMFEVRWRWNATRSLAIQRNRSGKRVPPQFQRMDAEDLIAHVFPDQIACQENLTGKRDVPDHPLVQQTIQDCLTEAMDIGELHELIGAIENKQLNLIAKDLRQPSPFAQEIINARPYAFLDDAPFEERRTNAIRNRSWLDPAEARDFSVLDNGAIERVKEEAWPLVSNPDELHDGLLSVAYITDEEFNRHGYQHWQQNLQDNGRLLWFETCAAKLWIATEKLPLFKAVFPDQCAEFKLPDFLLCEQWQQEDAIVEIVRGRLEGLGPVTANQLAAESGIALKHIQGALLALEVEGYVFQGTYTAQAQGREQNNSSSLSIEWCERRLLQRIHRYSIDAHRNSIKPVSLQTFTHFLFDSHRLLPVQEGLALAYGKSGVSSQLMGADIDGQTKLQASLNLLDGVAAPAAVWESDIFPLRIADYDPAWLDVMCISGRVAWGRYCLPSIAKKSKDGRKMAGPIKSTPISLSCRSNLDIWHALASSQDVEQQAAQCSSVAQRIETDLRTNGASFFNDMQLRSGLLKSQLEEGLAELVSKGRISSDSFTGLRALLTPNEKKPGSHRRRGRKAMFGVEDAGRWALIDRPQSAADETASWAWSLLDEDQLERLVMIYLQRWGVVFRKLLDKETFAPPWRVLLRTLRTLELRGTIRGGRFVAGVSGEQFAFPATVDALRKRQKQSNDNDLAPVYHVVAATDPVNLLDLVLPATRLARLAKNRVLFQDAVPVAILASGQVHFLREVEPERQWKLQQLLLKRNFPPQLRSYLGTT